VLDLIRKGPLLVAAVVLRVTMCALGHSRPSVKPDARTCPLLPDSGHAIASAVSGHSAIRHRLTDVNAGLFSRPYDLHRPQCISFRL
jgi:hypothetical protein